MLMQLSNRSIRLLIVILLLIEYRASVLCNFLVECYCENFLYEVVKTFQKQAFTHENLKIIRNMERSFSK